MCTSKHFKCGRCGGSGKLTIGTDEQCQFDCQFCGGTGDLPADGCTHCLGTSKIIISPNGRDDSDQKQQDCPFCENGRKQMPTGNK